MTLSQQIITIAMCVLGTMLTRFLPFAVFSSKRPTPPYIQYLGKVLPGAIFPCWWSTACDMFPYCRAVMGYRS